MKWRLTVLFSALCLGACATHPPAADLASLEQQKVPAAIYDKVNRGEYLTFDDIITLTRHHVPEAVIIHAINRSSSAYQLTSQQISRLKSEHVSDPVIDAMLRTQEQYYTRTVLVYPEEYGFYGGFAWYGYPYHFHHHHHWR